MSLINIANLTFAYDGNYDTIFDNVSFQMDTDWKLGFTGRNGRGKTTFMKLMMGDYEYRGSIQASVKFDYFPFEIKSPNAPTITIIESINPSALHWEICRELSLLKLEEEILDRPFDTLSQGEQTKVMLAILFTKDNHFLLIDEPTTHLDEIGRKNVSDYLNNKKGFIVISHDRKFLDGCIDHILSINKTKIEIQKGNFSSWQKNKTNQDQFEIEENQKLQKDVERLQKAIMRTEGWSHDVEKTKYGTRGVDKGYIGHKSAKLMKRSKAIAKRRENTILEKSKLLKDLETADPIALFHIDHYQENLIEVSDLVIGYDDSNVIEHFSMDFKKGERIVLKGKNGSGKSTLLKALIGQTAPKSGTIRHASGLVISYVPQDTSHLMGDFQNYALEQSIDPALFKSILSKLDFTEIQFDQKMENLSAGQKKKVLLAKSICERAHLYIWDEPLNYVDVLSRLQLEDMILKYAPSMILVEHDVSFIETIGTTFVTL
ncbi:MAG: ABC-F type ribosomal protection protein [Clostridiales bacterium]|nr:ABC-F type ribosomal protection protein [Clostridiales bacterium]